MAPAVPAVVPWALVVPPVPALAPGHPPCCADAEPFCAHTTHTHAMLVATCSGRGEEGAARSPKHAFAPLAPARLLQLNMRAPPPNPHLSPSPVLGCLHATCWLWCSSGGAAMCTMRSRASLCRSRTARCRMLAAGTRCCRCAPQRLGVFEQMGLWLCICLLWSRTWTVAAQLKQGGYM